MGRRVRVREPGGWVPALRAPGPGLTVVWVATFSVVAFYAVALVEAVLALLGVVDGLGALRDAPASFGPRFEEGGLDPPWAAAAFGGAVIALVYGTRAAFSIVRGGFTLTRSGVRGAWKRPLRTLSWDDVERLAWEDRSTDVQGADRQDPATHDRVGQPMTLVAVLSAGGYVRIGARHLDPVARGKVEVRLQRAREAGCCPVPLPSEEGADQPQHVRVLPDPEWPQGD